MRPPLLPERDPLKRVAAAPPWRGSRMGWSPELSSGSTAAFAVDALAARIAKGLRVVAIRSSGTTAVLARQLRVPLNNFVEHRRVDVTIDGAEQVERDTLNLVKGLGGALLHEKIVASASDRMIVVVDETKLVDCSGRSTPRPAETATFSRLSALGCEPRLRLAGDKPFTTDSGNYIIDCVIAEMPAPAALEARLSAIIGVVQSGLFIGLTSKIVVGRSTGAESSRTCDGSWLGK